MRKIPLLSAVAASFLALTVNSAIAAPTEQAAATEQVSVTTTATTLAGNANLALKVGSPDSPGRNLAAFIAEFKANNPDARGRDLALAIEIYKDSVGHPHGPSGS